MRLIAFALPALALTAACAAPPPIDDGIPDVVARENMPSFCRAQVATRAGVSPDNVSVLPAEAGGVGVLVFADVTGGEASGAYTCNFAGDGTFRGVSTG